MADPRAPPIYRIFLLTVWQESAPLADSLPEWRFRLEDAKSGARWGFANPEALLKALSEGLLEKEERKDESDS